MEPRPAATVVVARDGKAGVEVVVLRRAADSPFAGGYVVFPGGVVDRGDGDRAARWFGAPSEAARACAVRELAEEAGLVLGSGGLRELAEDEDPEAAISAAPPAASLLPEVARWLAPEFLAVRFDAVFYAVAAPPGLELRPDGREVDQARWSRPADVLERFPLWEALMWPTYRTLEVLAGCRTIDDVLSLRVEQEPPPASLLARRVSPEWQEPSGSEASPPDVAEGS
jgi:8-oxo-dGTP pyrophosphatase MutT (NUDIX family)